MQMERRNAKDIDTPKHIRQIRRITLGSLFHKMKQNNSKLKNQEELHKSNDSRDKNIVKIDISTAEKTKFHQRYGSVDKIHEDF